MRNLVFFVFLLLITSCNNDKYYKKEIIGNWEEVKKKYKEGDDVKLAHLISPMGYINYSFFFNGTFIDRRGFFKTIEGENWSDRKHYYLGSKSKYTVENKILKLYDIESKKYNEYQIVDLKNDTLSLTVKGGDTLYLKRKNYNIKCKGNFDKIIISSSGCYGSCPVSIVLIDKSGDFIFEGRYYTTKIGLYKSKISKNKFQEIVQSFQKADWANLKENYTASHTDDEQIKLIFIKDNKIIKTISDYGREAPEELRWAYQPLRYLYQQLKLAEIRQSIDTLDSNTKLIFKLKTEKIFY